MTTRSNRANAVVDQVAIEASDPDRRDVTAMLDELPGAFEEAMQGLDEARRGLGTDLEAV